MEFMMTQTKHKIFNKKIKTLLLLLLILICALIRCGCVGNATEQHAAGSFIAPKTQAVAEMVSVDAAAASFIDGQNSDEAASIRSTAIYERNNGNHNESKDNNHSDVDNSAEDQQDNLQDNAEQTTLKNQLNNNNDNDNNNSNNSNNKGKRIGNLMIRKNSTKIDVADDADDAVDVNEGDAVDDRDVDGVIRKGTSTGIRRRRGSRRTRTSRASTSLRNDAVINTENNVVEQRFDVGVVDDAARDETPDGIAATTTAPEMTMAMLKQKLLYDLAIKRKQIPRMTYFTCNQNDDDSNTNENNNNNNGIANTKTINNRKMRTLELMQLLYSSKTAASVADDGSNINNNSNSNNNNSNNSIPRIYPKDVFIKVVRIDQLINKQRGDSNNNHHHHSNKQRSGVSKDAPNHNLNDFAEGRNAEYSFDSNWLQEMLSPERLRQMVVLDLGCGAASRKVIETASNNGLFNAAYHWLLIDEDYVLNRQTPINGNNNNHNNNNNNKDDDDTDTDADVDNRINKNVNLKKRIDFKTVANRFAAKLSESKSKALDKNPQQELQQQQQKPFATDGVDEDEEDEDEDEEENVDNMKNMKIIEKFLEKINININTELILAKLTLRGGSTDIKHTILQKKDYFYTLRDVWNPGRQYGGQLNITEIGNFSLDGGLQLVPGYRRSTTITQRVDMKKARIRCLIVITHKNRTDTLEHYLTTRYDTHLDSMHRFNFALLTHIRDLYNFSFVLSETASWGYLTNGTFDGMIGALTRKEADIGGSPIFFRLERAKVIDYTARTWVARPCFIFRHPRTSKNDRIVFLQPFSNDIWILTAVCGTITILFLWTLSSLERRMSLAGVHGGSHASRPLPLLIQKNSMLSTTTGAKTTTTKTTVSSSLQAARNSTTIATGRKSSNNNNYNNNNSINSKSSIAAGISKTAAGSQQAAASAGGHPFRQHCVRWFTTLCGHSGDDAARRRVGLFFESVLLYVGLICQQGLAYSTKFFSGRCVITTSLFFSFAIYQFYSASIVGTLLMDKPNTIRTLRDLMHSSLEIGIEDIVYNRDFFVRTTDPDALELYAKKVTAVRTSLDPANRVEVLSGRDFMRSESSNWYDPDFGVAKIKDGGFAFHVDVATAYKIISESFSEKEICDLSEIQLFPPQKMVSIVQKGSPLRKVMAYGFRRVAEAGLTDYQRKVWHSPKPRCIKKIHTDDLKVDMQTFSSAFLMLIYGFAVSLLTLGFEILHHNLWQRLAGLQVA